MPFNPNYNYSYNSDGTFSCKKVQKLFRDIQLACQMHRHTKSCFKYCRPWECICRHDFPYCQEGPTNPDMPVIHSYHDRKYRKAAEVLPARNNAWLNSTLKSPLLTLAVGGNHDNQFIGNQIGAAEYTASYALKNDLPDFKLLSNFLYKRLLDASTDYKKLNAVATAIIDSTIIGSIEAIYLIFGIDLVKSTRDVENVNPLHREKMKRVVELEKEKLDMMNDEDEPYQVGVKSHLGKRSAYQLLMQQQRSNHNGQCNITFYAMLVNFTLGTYKPNTIRTKAVLDQIPLIDINEYGIVTNCDGDFKIGDIIFKKRQKPAVLNLCPYIPVDHKSETSCYATLLLHVPWPNGGEHAIVNDSISAVDKFNELLKDGDMPKYTLPLLQKAEKTEKLFQNNSRQENDSNSVDSDDDVSVCSVEDLGEDALTSSNATLLQVSKFTVTST